MYYDKKINYLENLKLKIIVGGAHTNNENFPKNWLLDNINKIYLEKIKFWFVNFYLLDLEK